VLGLPLTRPSLLVGGLCCAAALQAPSDAFAAQIITFTFNRRDNGLTSVVKTVDGVTATFNNFSPTAMTIADSDGLCVAGLPGSLHSAAS